ncbi:MAG: DUF6580 family putative transport protein [Acidobacteriota bacterium]
MSPRPDAGGLLWMAVGLVGLAALSRLVVHPWNVAPVGAMALFGGMALRRPGFAFGAPLLAMAISDLLLGLMGRAQTMAGWVYGAFFLVALLGFLLRGRLTAGRVLAGSLGGSLIFFLVTNFGVWVSGAVAYPMTPAGLASCYVAAIPFFGSSLAGDLVWNAVLFGSFGWMVRRARGPITAQAA